MIATIIANAVEETPGISYQMIREILSPFANDYALTDNILQDGRDMAKVERFGVPEDNVQFALGVFTELTVMGHEVFFLYTNCAQTLKNVSAVVLLEELERKKKEKMSMLQAERRNFLSNWMTVHDIFLNTALVSEGGTPFKFLTGILVAPSTSKAQVPFLQDVIRALGNIPYSRLTERQPMPTCLHWPTEYSLAKRTRQTGHGFGLSSSGCIPS
jgi:hypothetical protein